MPKRMMFVCWIEKGCSQELVWGSLGKPISFAKHARICQGLCLCFDIKAQKPFVSNEPDCVNRGSHSLHNLPAPFIRSVPNEPQRRPVRGCWCGLVCPQCNNSVAPNCCAFSGVLWFLEVFESTTCAPLRPGLHEPHQNPALLCAAHRWRSRAESPQMRRHRA